MAKQKRKIVQVVVTNESNERRGRTGCARTSRRGVAGVVVAKKKPRNTSDDEAAVVVGIGVAIVIMVVVVGGVDIKRKE
jgi:hypothetical protein